MTRANTHTHYGSVTKTFHWLTALLIITAFPLGLIAENMAFGTESQLALKAWLFTLHKTVGVTVFFVAIARILLAVTQTKPASLNPNNKVEHFAAETMHWLLYMSLVLVPLSGWLHHAATSGFAPLLYPFGNSLPFIPKSEAVAAFFGGWHFVFTKVLAVAILLHVAGALKHFFIDKDKTLQRMLPGNPALGTLPPEHHSKTPFFAALAVYLLAMAVGSLIGSMNSEQDHDPSKDHELATVSSEWSVQDGTLAISVVQFGNEVTGEFANWTADISFDPESGAGHVNVVIAVDSLTLGSVSSQAKGADYFDTDAFPTATFSADITPSEGNYIAKGDLEIKGNKIPMTLAFTLDVVDNIAKMSGQTAIYRMDFGVGSDAQPTDSSLGFEVQVNVDLTADKL